MIEVKKKINIKEYCVKNGRCVRGGECKTAQHPMVADTENGKRYGAAVGKEYYICPYLIMVKED